MDQYITVYNLNRYIKAQFDSDVGLQDIYVKGEISNYRPHPSGHMYFTLKDEKAAISSIMFSSYARHLNFRCENGNKVIARGHVSVYEKTGQYQLYVTAMQLDGVGNLYARFEALKKKLSKEGLFDDAHKKAIPAFPRRIAILSAKQGAALQDTIRTIKARFPICPIYIFPIPVQGRDAYKHIIAMLNGVDRLKFSTILLVRGGGSIEDLWNFNEEDLARCIYQLTTPIITGIGHETDFTLADFVADYRAATPTYAAMAATPDWTELQNAVDERKKQLRRVITSRLTQERVRLDAYRNHYMLKNPAYIYENEWMKLNNYKDRLHHYGVQFVSTYHNSIEKKCTQMTYTIRNRLTKERYQFAQKTQKLDLVSPLKILSRGYSIVKKDDHVVESANDLTHGDTVSLQFKDGLKEATVK